MFSKASKHTSANTNTDGVRSTPKSSVPSIISADLRINGDLICSGDVDIQAAKNAGMRSILVHTGAAGKDGKHPVQADHESASLLEAVRFLLAQQS